MDDRCSFFDSNTYYDNGIKKRDNLKANSPGRSGSSNGSRPSFFTTILPLHLLQPYKSLQARVIFVAEPAEIPIFRTPEAAPRQMERFRKPALEPKFFNST